MAEPLNRDAYPDFRVEGELPSSWADVYAKRAIAQQLWRIGNAFERIATALETKGYAP